MFKNENSPNFFSLEIIIGKIIALILWLFYKILYFLQFMFWKQPKVVVKI